MKRNTYPEFKQNVFMILRRLQSLKHFLIEQLLFIIFIDPSSNFDIIWILSNLSHF